MKHVAVAALIVSEIWR